MLSRKVDNLHRNLVGDLCQVISNPIFLSPACKGSKGSDYNNLLGKAVPRHMDLVGKLIRLVISSTYIDRFLYFLKY
jgi:hypothetical protein